MWISTIIEYLSIFKQWLDEMEFDEELEKTYDYMDKRRCILL